jgi:tRNA-specific 2-thiouridylase
MRIVVAMSGGVDSSVAASLLAEAGHEVVGLSMQLYDHSGPESFGSCCSLDDLYDARQVAATLGIPHYIVNFEERFQETVVDRFVSEYASGRTPIPCVHCNADLKFSTLVERAAGLDAAAVSTGHYARVAFDEDRRRYVLRRGLDADKDQSYFLFSLTQDQLARAVFPVGGLTKAQVREHARSRNLRVAEKPDSHEICFVPDGDAGGFVERRLGEDDRSGDIVDSSGKVLGRHRGVHRLTVGQRRGLGLAEGVPLYVLHLDASRREVTVGSRGELGGRSLAASRVNWIEGAPPAESRRVTARIRHGHRDAPAVLTPAGTDRAVIEFDEPQIAIAPGQAVVFYDRADVIGGGWIDSK